MRFTRRRNEMKKVLIAIMIMCIAMIPTLAEEVEIDDAIVEEVDIILDEEQIVPQAEEYEPERHVSIRVSCADKVSLGDTVMLYAILEGYEGVDYYLQWQISKDNNNWRDISGANSEKYTITVTEENCADYFRVAVISEE